MELSSVVDPQKGLNAETEEPDYPNPPVRNIIIIVLRVSSGCTGGKCEHLNLIVVFWGEGRVGSHILSRKCENVLAIWYHCNQRVLT